VLDTVLAMICAYGPSGDDILHLLFYRWSFSNNI